MVKNVPYVILFLILLVFILWSFWYTKPQFDCHNGTIHIKAHNGTYWEDTKKACVKELK